MSCGAMRRIRRRKSGMSHFPFDENGGLPGFEEPSENTAFRSDVFQMDRRGLAIILDTEGLTPDPQSGLLLYCIRGIISDRCVSIFDTRIAIGRAPMLLIRPIIKTSHRPRRMRNSARPPLLPNTDNNGTAFLTGNFYAGLWHPPYATTAPHKDNFRNAKPTCRAAGR